MSLKQLSVKFNFEFKSNTLDFLKFYETNWVRFNQGKRDYNLCLMRFKYGTLQLRFRLCKGRMMFSISRRLATSLNIIL